MASKNPDLLTLRLGIVGLITGGLIGFLYRPSALIIGQLPFSTVITRGANLKGVEQMLIPMAQTSFNNMMVAAVIGAAIGIVIGLLFSRK